MILLILIAECGLRVRVSFLFDPERDGYTSPGQRPGTKIQKDIALQGRNIHWR